MKILVAVDKTKESQVALGFACHLMEHFVAIVDALYVKPDVEETVTGGGGSGAAAVAALTPTSVGTLTLTSPGSNYTALPSVTISGGGDLSCYPDLLPLTEMVSQGTVPVHLGYTSGKGFSGDNDADRLVDAGVSRISFSALSVIASLPATTSALMLYVCPSSPTPIGAITGMKSPVSSSARLLRKAASSRRPKRVTDVSAVSFELRAA